MRGFNQSSWSSFIVAESPLGNPRMIRFQVFPISQPSLSPNPLFQPLKVEIGSGSCPTSQFPSQNQTFPTLLVLFLQAVPHLLGSTPEAGAFSTWSWEKFGMKDAGVCIHGIY